jgi:hypothetical protein
MLKGEDWSCWGHIPEDRRHRLRLLEDEESDLRELKLNRWRQQVSGTGELASVEKVAKVLTGPYSQ